MAGSVRVKVDGTAIIRALNTPGGGVFKWRDEIGKDVKATAEALAPENDPMNALHRGGEVGLFRRSFDWDRRGSSGHFVIARVYNTAPHAVFVELGRSASFKMQIFSWTEYGGKTVRTGGPDELPTNAEGKRIWPGSKRRPRKLSRGEAAFNARVAGLPQKIGEKTGDREGRHILRRALVAVMGSSGISA